MLGAMIWMDLFKKVHVKQLYKQQKEKSDLRRELEYVVTKKDVGRKKTPPKAAFMKKEDKEREKIKRNKELHGKALDIYIEEQMNVFIYLLFLHIYIINIGDKRKKRSQKRKESL